MSSYSNAMYQNWRKDPSSVDPSWRKYFESDAPNAVVTNIPTPATPTPASPKAATGPVAVDEKEIIDNLKVERLIRAFLVRGHHVCSLDPLGILNADLDASIPDEVTLSHYQFTDADLDREFVVPPSTVFASQPAKFTLREIVKRLEHVYCKHIGAEFAHIHNPDEVAWWRQTLETPFTGFDTETRKQIMKGMIEGAGFEKFLQKKFASEKRFGIDGCEVLIPGMQRLLRRLAEHGVETAVVGMPHRGRLNVLASVMQKPIAAILKEFQSLLEKDDEGAGDVKYHLGRSSDVTFPDLKRTMHLSLLANPSHLETVDPVVEGKARAEQDYRKDTERRKVVPILLHGDAAFAGQGVVFETFGLSGLENYSTGGTIHIVVNNQIGFTTDPRFSRSTPYCTDIAKAVNAPILHVNADDTEAVVHVFNMAADFRQKFHRDVVVDLVCYRRFGHNEADQPIFTQPRMYKEIAKKKHVQAIYADELIKNGVVTQEWINNEEAEYESKCEQAFKDAPTYKAESSEFYGSRWASVRTTVIRAKIQDTGVPFDTLREIGNHVTKLPEGFVLHNLLERFMHARIASIQTGKDLDFALCETLAFGTLLQEGALVRLSGQDVERGTFSHRHAVLHNQKGDDQYVPLSNLPDSKASFTVSNSNLSEYAVLGFELGYSQANPQSLVCWEAQFGDFANTAQIIADQMISSGEAKWARQSGLVLLLPHGYEGMGPEHSSARMERFLQECNDEESEYPVMDHVARTQIERCNFQVMNCTTAANYFHALRRQVHREFRKPLVIFTPKSLLRHPGARSTMEEIGPNTRFLRLIPETDKTILLDGQPNPDVKRVIFCQGKVYYDLLAKRTQLGLKNVAIARVEQISPFPFDLVHRQADDFPNAEIVWVQEEPRNMGAWTYVDPRIETALSKTQHHSTARARYIGRAASAATATGDKKLHKKELDAFVNEAFSF